MSANPVPPTRGEAVTATQCYQHEITSIPVTIDHGWVDENGVSLYPYQDSWWGDGYASLVVNDQVYLFPQAGVTYGPTPVTFVEVCKGEFSEQTTTTTTPATTTTRPKVIRTTTTTDPGVTTSISVPPSTLPKTGPETAEPMFEAGLVILLVGAFCAVWAWARGKGAH